MDLMDLMDLMFASAKVCVLIFMSVYPSHPKIHPYHICIQAANSWFPAGLCFGEGYQPTIGMPNVAKFDPIG